MDAPDQPFPIASDEDPDFRRFRVFFAALVARHCPDLRAHVDVNNVDAILTELTTASMNAAGAGVPSPCAWLDQAWQFLLEEDLRAAASRATGATLTVN